MGLRVEAIYKFVWHMNLKLFFICFCARRIAIEIRTFNAVKNVHVFSPLRHYCLRELRCDLLQYVVLNKWKAKLVIQVLVEYQVPNFEMDISFKLRLEYVNYAYHWNRQGMK